MVWLHLVERLGLAALVRGVLAARGEPAAGGGIDGAGQLALQYLPLDGVVDVHRRDGGQQRPAGMPTISSIAPARFSDSAREMSL